MWLLMLNLEVNWEKVLHASSSSSSSCSSGFICSIWCLTQYPAREKKKAHSCGRRKSRVFCPSWNLIQKFWILEDKKQTEGEGRQAGNRRTDFSVSANSLNNLQPPTEVSPFVTFWLREAAAQWSQMKSPCELWATLLTAEWTWDIRFQSFLHWFFCAHRFNRTPASFALFITTSCGANFAGRAVVRDFTPQRQKRAHRSLCAFQVRGWFPSIFRGRADIIALYTW